MPAPLTSVDSLNPLYTSVDSQITAQFVSKWSKSPMFWKPEDYFLSSRSSSQINVVPFPQPVRIPEQVVAGGQMERQQIKLGSVTVRSKLYKTSFGIDRYVVENPTIDAIFSQIKSHAVGLRDMHLAITAGKVLATNPTQTRIDGKAFFATDHPIDPKNPLQTNLSTGAATWSNLNTSTPFNHSNLSTILQSAASLAWANGTPCYATDFTIFMPMGINIFKAAHLLYGDMLGGNFNVGMVSGANDVGANSNIWEAARRKFGFNIKLAALPEYAGTSTDWFLATGIINPFVHVENNPFTAVDLTQAGNPIVELEDQYVTVLSTRFGLALGHPLSLIKCTA